MNRMRTSTSTRSNTRSLALAIALAAATLVGGFGCAAHSTSSDRGDGSEANEPSRKAHFVGLNGSSDQGPDTVVNVGHSLDSNAAPIHPATGGTNLGPKPEPWMNEGGEASGPKPEPWQQDNPEDNDGSSSGGTPAPNGGSTSSSSSSGTNPSSK